MKKLVTILLVGMLALNLVACGSTKSTSSNGGEITADVKELNIGLVAPLSGDNALYGTDQSRGYTMAADEINAAGGVYGAKIVVKEYDDQGDPQNAAKGAQKFADDESIIALGGSCLSNCTLAMAPIFDDAGLADMVVSSSSPSLSGCSQYFFRLAVQDDQVGPQMAKAMLAKGYKKIVVLYPNNDYGSNLSTNLASYAQSNGGNIVDSIKYPASDQDFTAILTTVKNENPDAVALCGTVTDSSLLIKQMASLGINCFKMGGTSLYNSKALTIAGDTLNGVGCISVYISSNTDQKVQDFVTKYKARYNETPDAFAALAYDSMYTFADSCKRAMADNGGKITRDLVKNYMKTANMAGVTGTVKFNDKNEWVRDYLTLTVKNGDFALDK